MSSSDNQPTTSTRGGASAHPTPANNSGGGAGWGDSGFLKGGLEGVVCMPHLSLTIMKH